MKPRQNTVRLHARGPRGEACIIVRTLEPTGALDGAGADYRLATGERLIQAAETMEFTTLDGKRTFRVI